MKRTRNVKKYVESSETEDEGPAKKISSVNVKPSKHNEESSSESDIENYLLKPEKLDLDSEFFNTVNKSESPKQEENTFSGVQNLSDSESDKNEDIKSKEQKNLQNIKSPSKSTLSCELSSKMNFKQLQDYNKKIEDARKQVEIYKAKKQAEENKNDILNLLAAGEGIEVMKKDFKAEDLHSSDFESYDSEQETWEEIKTEAIQENDKDDLVPQKSLQITVNMPDNVKKKKGVDLLAAMKRRLNRIRKENQVLVHKVHLLCCIAHGNYVNACISDTDTLAVALSLLPSDKCYPSDRIDLSYLEQIVNWYKRTIKNIEKPVPEGISLSKCLQLQMSRKEAFDKKMLACIFLSILRALGIHCRIVMSLQVEPLRPPANELHTVSTKSNKKNESNLKSVKSTSKISNLQQSETKSTLKGDVTKLKTFTKEPDDNKDLSAKIGSDKVTKSEVINAGKIVEENKKVQINNKLLASKTKTKKSTQVHSSKVVEKDVLKQNKNKNTKGTELKVIITRTTENISNTQTDDNTNLSDKKNLTAVKKDPKSKLKQRNNPGSLKSKTLEPLDQDIIELNTNKSGKRRSTRGTASKDFDMNSSISSNRLETKDKTFDKPLKKKQTTKTKAQKTMTIIHNTPSSKSELSAQSSSSQLQDIKQRKSTRNTKSVPQVDGTYASDFDEEMILQLDGANDTTKKSHGNKPSKDFNERKKSSNHKMKSKKEIETDSESEFEPESRKRLRNSLPTPNLKKLKTEKRLSAKSLDVRNDVINLVKGRIAQQKQADNARLVRRKMTEKESDSDSDYVPEPIKKKVHDSDDDFAPKTKVKKRIQVKKNNVLSDSENESEKKKKKGNDVWVEVFLEAEEKWISVDVIYGQVHCVKEIYQRASHPVSYVVAWDNNNKLKDITQRYCQNYNTVTRKQRVDEKWWNESLKPFMGTRTARDKEEDDDLARQQLDQPLPKAISEYKNNPLYALKRHLLKFQAIYPPEPPTLGFIRGEAVYPRSCVYTLHSRDIWLKQAKVVKLGEQPYKIVTARPKYDRLSNKTITGQTLEIFGPWQVQDYEPPTAENGIVPKNAFGNVDLFKPCMLPKGCVHLKLPGLNKIARKMNVDIASAIVGFDFHGGWSHPVYDGFVVCKEYEDQLISAWELEQDELERKEEEKINKRVYGNWKKLIKGLLIRERLKAKYDFGEPTTNNTKAKKIKVKSQEK